MTCIVGIASEGTVWLGGDSIAIDGLQACSIADPKVFVNEQFAIGYCGSFRAGQILKYAFTPPERPRDRDDMGYLVVDVVDAVRELWRSKGILKVEDDVQEVSLKALVGYSGNLYYMDEDLQIGQVRSGYFSIGCGADVALGALHALAKTNIEPREKLQRALEAAVEWCAGVKPPFSFVNTVSVPARKRSRPKR